MLNKYKSLVIDKQKAVLALYASEKCEQVIIINYSTRNWIRERIQAFILFAQVTVPPPQALINKICTNPIGQLYI